MDKIDKVINTKNYKKVMEKPIILAVIALFLIPLSMAAPSYTFRQYTSPDLKIHCFDINMSLCNAAVDCYYTIYYPNQSIFLQNVSTSSTADYFNYTMPQLDFNGIYSVVARCEGTTNGIGTFTFKVNPTGFTQQSILNNPFMLIFLILGTALLIVGVYSSNAGIGFLGSLMFMLGGIYTLVYGLNDVTDIYSRGIGGTILGIGFIFMMVSAYEWIWGGES